VTEPDFDLAIAGGGIVGSMLAWRALHRHPQWRVLWFDQSMFGLGTSAYAGALLTPFGRTPAHRDLLAMGFNLIPDLEREAGPLPLRDLTGWYVVSPDLAEERRGWFLGDSPGLASAGHRDRLHELIPHMALGDKAILGPFPVRQGRPSDFISLIARMCRNSPLFSIWEGVRLESWRSDARGIRLAFTEEPSVQTRRLALATGPWAGRQLADDGVFSGVRVKRVAACHIETAPAQEAPVLYLGDHDSFLLPMPQERRWLLGFPSEAWDVPPERFTPQMDRGDLAMAHSIAGAYGGELGEHLHGGRCFYDCYREDRMPMAARVGGDPRIVFAGACAGSGFRFSPGLAESALNLLDAP
jgi:glycine/D-amino acid oxidase-like deaminating enzyme